MTCDVGEKVFRGPKNPQQMEQPAFCWRISVRNSESEEIEGRRTHKN